jgi:hypothetical protein
MFLGSGPKKSCPFQCPEFFPLFSLLCFMFYIYDFKPLCVDLCNWGEIGPASFFCMWSSNFPNTNY